MTELKTLTGNSKASGAVSMRLRPAEQQMFNLLAEKYGLYGATNAVRAAGRVLWVLSLDEEALLSMLAEYEKAHPDEEPCRFLASGDEE